ncbi:hypothetical protein V5799_014752 [Amblyomma americanum]|uniref:Secreted protein n=1 Tax=Amblyomma americanum TaxID=6943 RepID=A0AAQ4E243_AMBAM
MKSTIFFLCVFSTLLLATNCQPAGVHPIFRPRPMCPPACLFGMRPGQFCESGCMCQFNPARPNGPLDCKPPRRRA